MRHVRRILLGVIAVGSAAGGSALAGFNSNQLLGWAGVGRNSGHALSSAESSKVTQAIACIRKRGYGREADALTKMHASGDICVEENHNPQGNGGTANPTGVPADTGEINIQGGLFRSQFSKESLAAVLLHELLHVNSGDGVDNTDSNHCKAYWIEFKYVCAALAEMATYNPAVATASGYGAYQAKPGFSSVHVSNLQRQLESIYAHCPAFRTADKSAAWPPANPTKSFRNAAASANTTSGQLAATMDIVDGTNRLQVQVVGDQGFDVPYDRFELQFPVSRLTSVYAWTDTGAAPVVAVTGSNPSETTGKVFLLTDANSDGVPDGFTTIVNSNAGLACPSSTVAIDAVGGPTRWFMLDSATATIWGLSDADANGRPDGLGPLYASAADVADLTQAVALLKTGVIDCDGRAAGQVYLSFMNVATSIHDVRPDTWWIATTDSNQDGRIDSASARMYQREVGVFHPRLWDRGRVGEASVVARCPRNHVAQVLGADGAGQFTVSLGTAQSATDVVTVPLGTTLAAGQTYIIRDVASGLTSQVYTARGPVPEITGISPARGSAAGGTALTITGSGFGSAPPRVFVGDVQLTPVSSSDTEVTVHLPQRTPATTERAYVVVERAEGGPQSGAWSYWYQD